MKSLEGIVQGFKTFGKEWGPILGALGIPTTIFGIDGATNGGILEFLSRLLGG